LKNKCFRWGGIIMLVKRIIVFTLLILLVSFSAAADELVLSTGERYKGELLNDSLKIKTEYAEFNLDTTYLIRVEKRDNNFYLKLTDNSHYQAAILNELRFAISAQELQIKPAQLKSLSLKTKDNYSSKADLVLTTINGDFFKANFVEEKISIKTKLNAPFDLFLNNLIMVERLGSDLFSFKLKDGRELEAQFAQETIIIWPKGAELIEFKLKQLQKMNFNGS